MWGGQDPHQRILMGPPGDSPRSGYEFQLVPRGQGEVARFYMTQSGGEYPSLGMDPRGFRAIVGPSEMMHAPTLNMAVQDFTGTCVLPKPAKKAAKKKAICGPTHSDFNQPLDQYSQIVMSDGRITEVKESSDQTLVPFKKPTKPKQKAIVWDQQAGDSQALVPFKKPTKPKKKAIVWDQQAGDSQALVPFKKTAKPKQKAIDWDQQAGDSQALVPAKPKQESIDYQQAGDSQIAPAKKKTKKLTTGVDGQLVALKPAKKKALVPLPDHSNQVILQSPAKKRKPAKSVIAANQDIVSVTGLKKPRKRIAEPSGQGFKQEMQGEIRYTFKMTESGTTKKAGNLPGELNALVGSMTGLGQSAEKVVAKAPKKKATPKKQQSVDKASTAAAEPPVKAKPKQSGPPRNAQRWTITQVVEFVHSLPGCANNAKIFRAQAIDGKAFLMLTSDHLTGLGIKMGPALKIYGAIQKLNQNLVDNPPPVKKAKAN